MLTEITAFDEEEGNYYKIARSPDMISGVDDLGEGMVLLRFYDEEEVIAKGTFQYYLLIANGFLNIKRFN